MKNSRFPLVFTSIVLAADVLLVNGAFLATSLFRFDSWYPPAGFAPLYVRFQISLNLIFALALLLAGSYRDVWRASLGYQTVTAFKACLWGSAFTATWMFLERSDYSRIYVSFLLAQITVLIPFSRILLVRLNEVLHLRGHGVRPVMVVGDREPLRDLGMLLRLSPNLGYRVDAVVMPEFDTADNAGPEAVRSRDELRERLDGGRIGRIFICDESADLSRWKAIIDIARELNVETRLVRWPLLVPDFRARIHDLLTIPVIPEGVPVVCRGLAAIVKRSMDIAASSLALCLLSPFLALVALAIRLDSPGPVLYRQTRLGRGAKPFQILKFRSMHRLADEERANLLGENEADGPLFKIRNDPRVSKVGAFLRRFSLDELPQLFNVLRGDLSLVGPRPPLPDEALAYEPWQRHRLDVMQGITGLWQVSGRSRLSFHEMALLDLYYIESWSLMLDVEVLLETLPTVLHGDGAY